MTSFLTRVNKGMCNFVCPDVGTSISSCPNLGSQISTIQTVFPTLCKTGYVSHGYKCLPTSTNSPLKPSKCKIILHNTIKS